MEEQQPEDKMSGAQRDKLEHIISKESYAAGDAPDSPKRVNRRTFLGFMAGAGVVSAGAGAGLFYAIGDTLQDNVAWAREQYEQIEVLKNTINELNVYKDLVSGRVEAELGDAADDLEHSVNRVFPTWIELNLATQKDLEVYQQIIEKARQYETDRDLVERLKELKDRVTRRIVQADQYLEGEEGGARNRFLDSLRKFTNTVTGTDIPTGQRGIEARKRNLDHLTALIQVYDNQRDNALAQAAVIREIDNYLRTVRDLTPEERAVMNNMKELARQDPHGERKLLYKAILRAHGAHEIAGLESLQQYIQQSIEVKAKIDELAGNATELQTYLEQSSNDKDQLRATYQLTKAELDAVRAQTATITKKQQDIIAHLESMGITLNRGGLDKDPITENLKSLESYLGSWTFPATGAGIGLLGAAAAYIAARMGKDALLGMIQTTFPGIGGKLIHYFSADKKDIKYLEKGLDEREEYIKTQQEKLAEATQDKSLLAEAYTATAKEVDQYKVQVDELQPKVVQYESDLESKIKEIEDISKTITSKNELIRDQNKVMTDLREERSKLNEELQSLKTKLSHYEKKQDGGQTA